MYDRELEVAERAARTAGDVIMRHYARGGIDVEAKADATPVTAADRDANAAIIEVLRAAFPDDYVLSEELPDDDARLTRSRVWIVDPLDGTRDFVQRTGEFAVHVGLAIDGRAVAGAVHVPVAGATYVAQLGGGAWRITGSGKDRLRVSPTSALDEIRVGVSRLNPSPTLAPFLAKTGLAQRTVGMGASVKFMALAEGRLDAVINASTSEHEWDTCAPEVILREAAGTITDLDGADFRYNQRALSHPRGSLASNGVCHDLLLGLLRDHL
ncbi:MAG TPA: 3'(2'),5'-bisphosphate nucleotidase CysQ [Kofleriaceae bacterium]|nr:3'(2'),5'-bisphosphate nucleotidase CysQ [Kofleriaceae bacterium]